MLTQLIINSSSSTSIKQSILADFDNPPIDTTVAPSAQTGLLSSAARHVSQNIFSYNRMMYWQCPVAEGIPMHKNERQALLYAVQAGLYAFSGGRVKPYFCSTTEDSSRSLEHMLPHTSRLFRQTHDLLTFSAASHLISLSPTTITAQPRDSSIILPDRSRERHRLLLLLPLANSPKLTAKRD